MKFNYRGVKIDIDEGTWSRLEDRGIDPLDELLEGLDDHFSEESEEKPLTPPEK